MNDSQPNHSPPNIGLALSGGGFRATLFHLGVIRFLYDAGLLPTVRRVTSVSGGSILAAHLGLNWGTYTGDQQAFEGAAKELITFARSDVRGSIVRRRILSWLLILPRTVWPLVLRLFKRPHKNLATALQGAYDKLYRNATLGSLPAYPDINILSTSMTTGSRCWFTRREVRFDDPPPPTPIATTTLSVSYAVAASSAFPPLFPPIRIDHSILLCNQEDFHPPQYLTDGGVYDNLGIEGLAQLQRTHNDLDILLVSDAEGAFDWSVDRPYGFIVSRNVRVSDMLMRRISELQYDSLSSSRAIHAINPNPKITQAAKR